MNNKYLSLALVSLLLFAFPSYAQSYFTVNGDDNNTLNVCNDQPITVDHSQLTDTFFVALQKSDPWWHVEGIAEMSWFHSDSYPSYIGETSFDLNEFAGLRGFNLEPGQHYKLKLAATPWHATSKLLYIDPNCSSIKAPMCGGTNQPACACGGGARDIIHPQGKDASINNLVKTGVNNTNVNFANSPLMRAATWTSGSAHSWRSLMEFALPSLPANANVYNAKITLFATTQGSFDPYGNAHSLYSSSNASVLQRITENWSEDSVTWANRPTVSTTDQISIAQSADQNMDYDINVTEWIDNIYSGEYANHGFLIRLAQEQPYASLNFASGDNTNTALRPRLDLSYECELIDADNIVGDWHEDVLNRNGAIKTFVAESVDLGPLRFRETIRLDADGSAEVLRLAPNDAHYFVPGNWTLSGTELSIVYTDNGPWPQLHGTYTSSYTVLIADGNQLQLEEL